MKNTIGQRILVVILAPSILIFGLLTAFMIYAASQFVTVWAELELKGVSEINAADLTGRVNSMRISVMSAASVLNTLDAQDDDGRMRAENIIKSMFENPHVHNAWLAYEPDAFDGRDSQYKSDYPGAPSGRFMRSYVVEDGQIVVAPDMDEETLDDPDESAWYVKPRDTGSFYTDASNDTPNLYDYGLGDEPIYTMAFSMPVFRDGRVIGCVGADMSFDVTTLNVGDAGQAAIAVFYPDGHVFLAQDLAFANDSVDTLGFTEVPRIKAYFLGDIPLFLPDQYSKFLDTKAFTYFQPVAVSDEAKLYLYTSIPHSSVFNGMEPVFMMIVGILSAMLIFMLFIIIYVKRKISNPLRALMSAADAVSHGDLETEIPSFPDSKDEIGVLSRSLHRMVEQFRIYILRLEQTQDEKTIYSKIDELMMDGNASEVMEALLALLCDHLDVDKAMAVRLSDGSARIFSRREHGSEEAVSELSHDPPHQAQIMPMLAGKQLLIMNSYMISEQGTAFLDKDTRFACILPLRDGSRALGYIVLESKSEKNPFGMKAESILCNVAKAISGFINNDENRTELQESFTAEPIQENGAPGYLNVEGLDSDAAIQTMGGMADLYEQALKLLTSLLPETIEKLDACISSDMDAFTIEIHGLKGSLNNIGAYALGTDASHIEQAAKSGEASRCTELYAAFKDRLTEFYRSLISAFEAEYGKLPGNVLELVRILPEAEEEATTGDCASALNMLRPMSGFSFDRESDAMLETILAALEASNSDKALEGIQELRDNLTNWEEG